MPRTRARSHAKKRKNDDSGSDDVSERNDDESSREDADDEPDEGSAPLKGRKNNGNAKKKNDRQSSPTPSTADSASESGSSRPRQLRDRRQISKPESYVEKYAVKKQPLSKNRSKPHTPTPPTTPQKQRQPQVQHKQQQPSPRRDSTAVPNSMSVLVKSRNSAVPPSTAAQQSTQVPKSKQVSRFDYSKIKPTMASMPPFVYVFESVGTPATTRAPARVTSQTPLSLQNLQKLQVQYAAKCMALTEAPARSLPPPATFLSKRNFQSCAPASSKATSSVPKPPSQRNVAASTTVTCASRNNSGAVATMPLVKQRWNHTAFFKPSTTSHPPPETRRGQEPDDSPNRKRFRNDGEQRVVSPKIYNKFLPVPIRMQTADNRPQSPDDIQIIHQTSNSSKLASTAAPPHSPKRVFIQTFKSRVVDGTPNEAADSPPDNSEVPTTHVSPPQIGSGGGTAVYAPAKFGTRKKILMIQSDTGTSSSNPDRFSRTGGLYAAETDSTAASRSHDSSSNLAAVNAARKPTPPPRIVSSSLSGTGGQTEELRTVDHNMNAQRVVYKMPSGGYFTSTTAAANSGGATDAMNPGARPPPLLRRIPPEDLLPVPDAESSARITQCIDAAVARAINMPPNLMEGFSLPSVAAVAARGMQQSAQAAVSGRYLYAETQPQPRRSYKPKQIAESDVIKQVNFVAYTPSLDDSFWMVVRNGLKRALPNLQIVGNDRVCRKFLDSPFCYEDLNFRLDRPLSGVCGTPLYFNSAHDYYTIPRTVYKSSEFCEHRQASLAEILLRSYSIFTTNCALVMYQHLYVVKEAASSSAAAVNDTETFPILSPPTGISSELRIPDPNNGSVDTKPHDSQILSALHVPALKSFRTWFGSFDVFVECMRDAALYQRLLAELLAITLHCSYEGLEAGVCVAGLQTGLDDVINDDNATDDLKYVQKDAGNAKISSNGDGLHPSLYKKMCSSLSFVQLVENAVRSVAEKPKVRRKDGKSRSDAADNGLNLNDKSPPSSAGDLQQSSPCFSPNSSALSPKNADDINKTDADHNKDADFDVDFDDAEQSMTLYYWYILLRAFSNNLCTIRDYQRDVGKCQQLHEPLLKWLAIADPDYLRDFELCETNGAGTSTPKSVIGGPAATVGVFECSSAMEFEFTKWLTLIEQSSFGSDCWPSDTRIRFANFLLLVMDMVVPEIHTLALNLERHWLEIRKKLTLSKRQCHSLQYSLDAQMRSCRRAQTDRRIKYATERRLHEEQIQRLNSAIAAAATSKQRLVHEQAAAEAFKAANHSSDAIQKTKLNAEGKLAVGTEGENAGFAENTDANSSVEKDAEKTDLPGASATAVPNARLPIAEPMTIDDFATPADLRLSSAMSDDAAFKHSFFGAHSPLPPPTADDMLLASENRETLEARLVEHTAAIAQLDAALEPVIQEIAASFDEPANRIRAEIAAYQSTMSADERAYAGVVYVRNLVRSNATFIGVDRHFNHYTMLEQLNGHPLVVIARKDVEPSPLIEGNCLSHTTATVAPCNERDAVTGVTHRRVRVKQADSAYGDLSYYPDTQLQMWHFARTQPAAPNNTAGISSSSVPQFKLTRATRLALTARARLWTQQKTPRGSMVNAAAPNYFDADRARDRFHYDQIDLYSQYGKVFGPSTVGERDQVFAHEQVKFHGLAMIPLELPPRPPPMPMRTIPSSQQSLPLREVVAGSDVEAAAAAVAAAAAAVEVASKALAGAEAAAGVQNAGVKTDAPVEEETQQNRPSGIEETSAPFAAAADQPTANTVSKLGLLTSNDDSSRNSVEAEQKSEYAASSCADADIVLNLVTGAHSETAKVDIERVADDSPNNTVVDDAENAAGAENGSAAAESSSEGFKAVVDTTNGNSSLDAIKKSHVDDDHKTIPPSDDDGSTTAVDDVKKKTVDDPNVSLSRTDSGADMVADKELKHPTDMLVDQSAEPHQAQHAEKESDMSRTPEEDSFDAVTSRENGIKSRSEQGMEVNEAKTLENAPTAALNATADASTAVTEPDTQSTVSSSLASAVRSSFSAVPTAAEDDIFRSLMCAEPPKNLDSDSLLATKAVTPEAVPSAAAAAPLLPPDSHAGDVSQDVANTSSDDIQFIEAIEKVPVAKKVVRPWNSSRIGEYIGNVSRFGASLNRKGVRERILFDGIQTFVLPRMSMMHAFYDEIYQPLQLVSVPASSGDSEKLEGTSTLSSSLRVLVECNELVEIMRNRITEKARITHEDNEKNNLPTNAVESLSDAWRRARFATFDAAHRLILRRYNAILDVLFERMPELGRRYARHNISSVLLLIPFPSAESLWNADELSLVEYDFFRLWAHRLQCINAALAQYKTLDERRVQRLFSNHLQDVVDLISITVFRIRKYKICQVAVYFMSVALLNLQQIMDAEPALPDEVEQPVEKMDAGRIDSVNETQEPVVIVAKKEETPEHVDVESTSELEASVKPEDLEPVPVSTSAAGDAVKRKRSRSKRTASAAGDETTDTLDSKRSRKSSRGIRNVSGNRTDTVNAVGDMDLTNSDVRVLQPTTSVITTPAVPTASAPISGATSDVLVNTVDPPPSHSSHENIEQRSRKHKRHHKHHHKKHRHAVDEAGEASSSAHSSGKQRKHKKRSRWDRENPEINGNDESATSDDKHANGNPEKLQPNASSAGAAKEQSLQRSGTAGSSTVVNGISAAVYPVAETLPMRRRSSPAFESSGDKVEIPANAPTNGSAEANSSSTLNATAVPDTEFYSNDGRPLRLTSKRARLMN